MITPEKPGELDREQHFMATLRDACVAHQRGEEAARDRLLKGLVKGDAPSPPPSRSPP